MFFFIEISSSNTSMVYKKTRECIDFIEIEGNLSLYCKVGNSKKNKSVVSFKNKYYPSPHHMTMISRT